MKRARIISAKVLYDFTVQVIFSDKTSVIDFKPALDRPEWCFDQYRNDPVKFRNDMFIDFNKLIFGKCWRLYFDAMDLYEGKVIQR